ncbi:diguanylate cyclase [Shewanella sp. UCD-KL12]|uniref:transporter substrate-binding domain-containing diguanylate cyclase n=1 Tax=Shewanella sp. UCD-KL12 TaxID=1917163 RepID=UPI0009FB089D|nr:sensor domain-containing diguanylate cyclase [Shewanella sp. UCD-KL12]
MQLSLIACSWIRRYTPLTTIFIGCVISIFLPANTSIASDTKYKQDLFSQDKELVIANSKAWKPFSYIDKYGEPQGMLVDFWKEYGRVNGVKVSFLLTDWNDSLQLVRQGKADLHAGLLWSESRDEYLNYLDGIVEIETQLFFSSSLLGTDVDTFLESGKLGVVAGGYEQSYVFQHFPEAEVVSYKNNEEMIQRAFAGDIKAFVADFQVANFYLYTSDSPVRFSPVKHLYTGLVRPAVREDSYHLQMELRQGLKNLSQVDLDRITAKWIHAETVYPKYLLPLTLFCIVIAVITYIVHLRRAVYMRTLALSALNEELNRLARTDELTGINNRRNFMEQLHKRCISDSSVLSLILFDIDHFKSINDNFGHPAGDKVIQDIVKRVSDVLPKQSIFARVGGEEFCVLITNLGVNEAEMVAKSVQNIVSSQSILVDNTDHDVTISLGAVHCGAKRVDAQKLINLADKLMYKAKSIGRDNYQFQALN